MKKIFFAAIIAVIGFMFFGFSASAELNTDIVVSGYEVTVNNYVDETEVYYTNGAGRPIDPSEARDSTKVYIFVHTDSEVTINEFVCAPQDGLVSIVFELPVEIPEVIYPETPAEEEPEIIEIPEEPTPDPEPEIIDVEPEIPDPYIEPEITIVTPDDPEPEIVEPAVPEEPEEEEPVVDEPEDVIITPEVVDIPEFIPEKPETEPEPEPELPTYIPEEPTVIEEPTPDPVPETTTFTIIEEGSQGGGAKDGSGSFSTGGGNSSSVYRPATTAKETAETETASIETIEVENELVEIPYTGSEENIAFAMFMMLIAAAGAIIFLEVMKASKKTSR